MQHIPIPSSQRGHVAFCTLPSMECKRSLPCSQDPTTSPYLSQINPVHTFPSYFPKIYSNIVFP